MEEQADRLQESRGEGETGSTKSLDQMTPVVDALPADDWGHGELLATEVRPAAERQLVRLLDMRLMPMVVLIYIMNFIDRTAITAARLKGLESDLHLTDTQYDTVLAILYVTYVPAQVPSNMILNRIYRPSYYISSCVILWGVASAATGAVQNFSALLGVRILLGVPEAAFYPGCVYLLSRWYTRKELALRTALLYCGNLISNAFGSLMAAGVLSRMEGKLGIRAWRWLFYTEGAITVAVGLIAIWALPDYPHNTRWLSPAERRLAQARLAEDAGEADEDTEEDSAWHGLLQALKDPKVYVFALMSCSETLGLSFTSFFPTLTATLGYSTTISLILAAPPWILVAIMCCMNSWHADKTGERFFHIVGWYWCSIIGHIIAVSTMSTGARYVAMFVMLTAQLGNALTLVWVSNAIPRPPAKRAAAISVVNGIGNLGNLMGSYTWKARWGPAYHPSLCISISCFVFASFLAFVMRCILVKQNQRLDEKELVDLKGGGRERTEEAARIEGLTFQEALDRRRGFRYLY